MGMGKKGSKQTDDWLDAKRRCRLSDEEVRMARKLGFKPRGLIKNIPAKSQPWKAPVREWIRGLYAKRFGKARDPDLDRGKRGSSRLPTQTAPDPPPHEDLLPQYDTVNEEPYFVRESDGRIFSLEQAGQYLEEWDPGKELDEEDSLNLDEIDFEDDFEASQREIDSKDRHMLRRQKQFRMAAEAVAATMSQLPAVEKIAVFGSAACALEREVPRFREFRRARIEPWHECKDVDLAVWVSNLDHLKALQKARSRALNELMADRNIGVAHHQVDVFLLEPGTNRCLGRLCCFGQCPKGKKECLVEGCGRTRLLRQHEDFIFDWPSGPQDSVVLHDKNSDGPDCLREDHASTSVEEDAL